MVVWLWQAPLIYVLSMFRIWTRTSQMIFYLSSQGDVRFVHQHRLCVELPALEAHRNYPAQRGVREKCQSHHRVTLQGV